MDVDADIMAAGKVDQAQACIAGSMLGSMLTYVSAGGVGVAFLLKIHIKIMKALAVKLRFSHNL